MPATNKSYLKQLHFNHLLREMEILTTCITTAVASSPTACNEWEFYFVISFMREKGIVDGEANNSRV
jgi:hypothetical protein